MAKLKARGRTELWRVVRERDLPRGTDTNPVVWERRTVTLMSDGNFLMKRDVRWADGHKHTYDWNVTGKIKAGLSVEAALEIYAKGSYRIESAPGVSSFDRSYFEALAAAGKNGPQPERPAGLGSKVLVTETKAASAKKAAEKRAVKAKHEQLTKHGPGYYVINGSTSAGKPIVAELGPYETVEKAIEKAWERYKSFVSMRFTYLLPVEVVEAKSRSDAEYGSVLRGKHAYWRNGKNIGAPANPGQKSLF